jgi:hypothetical protein
LTWMEPLSTLPRLLSSTGISNDPLPCSLASHPAQKIDFC